MQARWALIPSRKGAKKFLNRYGEHPVCIRYCRLADLIARTESQRRLKQVGGKWNSTKRVWEIHDDAS